MATYYWIGGSSYRNFTDAYWSNSSGGPSNGQTPTSSDDVIFDSNSGTAICNVSQSSNCRKITFNNYPGELSLINYPLYVYGSIEIINGNPKISSANYIYLRSSSNISIKSNGHTWGQKFSLQLSNSSLVCSLSDDFSGYNFEHGTGIFTTNNYNVTLSDINTGYFLNGSNGQVINGGTTIFNVRRWSASYSTNATINIDTIKFNITSNDVYYFIGGGHTYNKVWFNQSSNVTGYVYIDGSNTFNEFKYDGDYANEIRFYVNTTQTIKDWIVSGNASKKINIRTSSTTGLHYLTKSGGGIVSSDYLTIQHSVARPWSGASGVDTWYAGVNSTDNQAVSNAGSGWIFTAPPASGPSNLKSYNTNLKANIKTINTNPIANVKSLNTNI